MATGRRPPAVGTEAARDRADALMAEDAPAVAVRPAGRSRPCSGRTRRWVRPLRRPPTGTSRRAKRTAGGLAGELIQVPSGLSASARGPYDRHLAGRLTWDMDLIRTYCRTRCEAFSIRTHVRDTVPRFAAIEIQRSRTAPPSSAAPQMRLVGAAPNIRI
jgi:hypothetical protein